MFFWRNTRSRCKQLTEEELGQFLEQGYIVVREVFSRAVAEQIIPLVWAKLDIARDDPSTWTGPRVMLRQVLNQRPIPKIHSRRYVQAVADLCGRGRWYAHTGAGIWPILLPGFTPPPWHPPSEDEWHVEGNWFHHRIDSAEQGLVCLQLFTDIEPGGGGTAVRVGSHRYTARILQQAGPNGLTEHELSRRAEAATRDLSVVEVIGSAGDIFLMHPFTVHASSSNTSGRVRIAANKPVHLYKPMNLMRRNPLDYSPVELAIVNALAENRPSSGG
jgi:hypothetical protein